MFSATALSAGYLFASMLVSSVGFGVFVYGKKELRVPQVVTGMVLMALPLFLGSPLALIGTSAAGMFGLWLIVRAGA